MLESIAIKKIATFNDVGIEINNLKKVNFIYGANGSGKTTISNYLTDVDSYSDCFVSWKNNQKTNILIYNKKFREDNFKNDSIAGVFTLGQATVAEIKEIECKKKKLEETGQEIIRLRESVRSKEGEKTTEDKKFTDKVWKDVYKKYEKDFKASFVGWMKGELFKNKLLSIYSEQASTTTTLDKLKEDAKTIFGKQPQAIDFFQKVNFNDILTIESNKIWQTKIIGKSDVDIAQLIQVLGSNDWVSKGREYLQDDKEICPFCQQKTITDDFKQQLENYFDETFTENIKSIKNCSDSYERLTNDLISVLENIEIKNKSNEKILIDVEKFPQKLKTLRDRFQMNKILIKNKINEPSRNVELTSTKEELDSINNIIQCANDEIAKHNNIVSNFVNARIDLIDSIWHWLASENYQDIKDYNAEIVNLKSAIDNLNKKLETKEQEYKQLDNEIKNLTQNVTSVQPSIDSINELLKSFGFLNFKIVASTLKNNQYQIQRENGELANETLSEGEITFITFLYFMQLAKGSFNEDDIREDRILIVDDPISSLDSNVLFIVSTFLKECIKKIKSNEGDIKQMILLTHNVYFHKEVSFIHGKSQRNAQTKYWILRKNNKISEIQCYDDANPISTSYELLWQELKNREHISNATIQNTMRRIIEYYFKILGKYGDDSLIQKFDTEEKRQICRSLVHWVNDGSHGVPDDLFIQSGNSQDVFFDVFQKIFKETNNQGHYDMMMGIAS